MNNEFNLGQGRIEEDEELSGWDSQVVNKKTPKKTIPYSEIFG